MEQPKRDLIGDEIPKECQIHELDDHTQHTHDTHKFLPKIRAPHE